MFQLRITLIRHHFFNIILFVSISVTCSVLFVAVCMISSLPKRLWCLLSVFVVCGTPFQIFSQLKGIHSLHSCFTQRCRKSIRYNHTSSQSLCTLGVIVCYASIQKWVEKGSGLAKADFFRFPRIYSHKLLKMYFWCLITRIWCK